MSSQTDLDQGGTFRQSQKLQLGPSVGDVIVPQQSVVSDITDTSVAIRKGTTFVAPISWPPASTDLNTVLAGTVAIWTEAFASLSIRTGGYATGNVSTGYNDPTSRGTWAYNGENYMNSPSNYQGLNAYCQNPNANYDWPSVDPTFSPLGMADITPNGLVLKSSFSFPAIQAAVGLVGGNVPYLGVLLSTAPSGRFAPPFLRRIRFTFDTMGPEDFPALWSTGEHYAVDINNPAFFHYEIDDMERFGNDAPNSHVAISTHIDPGTGIVGAGGDYATGSVVGPGILQEVVVLHNTTQILVWWNGVLAQNIIPPANSAKPGDRFHVILNEILNPTFHTYTPSSPPAQITVRSVEILKPHAVALDLIPPTPPVPVLTWGNKFQNGNIPRTTVSGTTVATLSRASSYTLLGLPGAIVTNLLLQSAAFSTSPWTLTGSSWTPNTTTAPDSTVTAGSLTETATGGFHQTVQAATFTTGNSYTLWAVVKSNGRDFAISVDDGTNFVAAKCDLTGGTITPLFGGYAAPTASITPLANGFYQVVLSFVAFGATTQNITLGCTIAGTTSYAGNGTSGLFLWHAQLEQSPGAHFYVPTTTTPATVNTNPFVVTGSNININGTLSAGAFSFYVRGVDGNGVPGIPPKLTATVI